MSNEERLTAAGWKRLHQPCDLTMYRWSRDGIDWYTEDEALVEALTAERDAAIARAERAERALCMLAPDDLPGIQLYLGDDGPGAGMAMFGIVETWSPYIVADRATKDGARDVSQWSHDEDSQSCELVGVGLLVDDEWIIAEIDKATAEVTARAEAAEALAASRPEITPEMAHAWASDVRLSAEQRLADDCGDALRAHAAKVSR